MAGDEDSVVLDGEVARMAKKLMEVYRVGSAEELIRRLVEEKYAELAGSNKVTGAPAPGQISASHTSRR
ncbi:MAG: hypothetical protein DRN49_01910 [Thaumarchaeota archaeon]|nr:MAG: hypothetical protein DRN49_01910 [Nitrososphaerota archaeon]